MESRGSTKGTQTEGGSVEGGSQHPGGEEIHYFSRSPGTIGVLADASRRIEEIANGNRSQQLYPRLPVLVRSPSYPDFGLQDIITGIPKPGHVSPVRRFFALFVIFDLLFCTIMWLICIMITGAKIQEGLKKEVYNYSIKTSLFDLVMSSSSRFVILILFYVLICLEHWWPVAMSSSSRFVILILFYVLICLEHWWPVATGSDLKGIGKADKETMDYIFLLIWVLSDDLLH
ncbi:unnamed protein product [Darwinula stevensoni]|uniref:MENTAL domain-containing protein n=1 Tax=Darwinula stevensoni TaxID=69355 RepID=A0A7R8X5N4_9CRUS|nr:unnamed protein product [Darwinula stevensoni]CAG0884955.1 unnamed protein product [Darwinula stevensoni]